MTLVTDASKLEENEKKERLLRKIREELKKVREYRAKVGIFGDAGVGKSSLCNALFGKPIAKISNVAACTREPQEIELGNDPNSGITLVDVPGVGEDPKRHEEYRDLYRSLAPTLDLIIWAIKADDRKYLSSIDIYENILKPNVHICPVVFVVTQCDKIDPVRSWNVEECLPSEKQLANINEKIVEVSNRFDTATSKIVAIASDENYNLIALVNKIVEVLPAGKKFAFAREAKQENVSEEAAESAEKGVFDHIKEALGTAWNYIKDEAVDLMLETAQKYAPKLIKKLFSFFK